MIPKFNKRGQIIDLVYVLFIVILIIFDVVIVYSLLTNIDVRVNLNTKSMQHDSVSALLLYSPDCLAYKASYDTPLGARWRVYPGVIDRNKLSNAASCVATDHAFTLYELDANLTKTFVYRYGDCNHLPRKANFLVRIRNSTGDITPGMAEICT